MKEPLVAKKKYRRFTKKPCPVCGSADVTRECWGMCLNYCNKCGKLYEVFPAKYMKLNAKTKKTSKRASKKSPLKESVLQ